MDNYVNREEFEALKEKVNKIENDTEQASKLLIEIDKKVDGILIKLSDNETVNELTIKPINERIKKIEDNQKWIWRTIAGSIITIILNLIANFIKYNH